VFFLEMCAVPPLWAPKGARSSQNWPEPETEMVKAGESSVQTTKRRGELTGPRQVKCIVTITKRNGIETLAINDVEPRGIADGDYTLTVKGQR
jgi:hypothetical protein